MSSDSHRGDWVVSSPDRNRNRNGEQTDPNRALSSAREGESLEDRNTRLLRRVQQPVVIDNSPGTTSTSDRETSLPDSSEDSRVRTGVQSSTRRREEILLARLNNDVTQDTRDHSQVRRPVERANTGRRRDHSQVVIDNSSSTPTSSRDSQPQPYTDNSGRQWTSRQHYNAYLDRTQQGSGMVLDDHEARQRQQALQDRQRLQGTVGEEIPERELRELQNLQSRRLEARFGQGQEQEITSLTQENPSDRAERGRFQISPREQALMDRNQQIAERLDRAEISLFQMSPQEQALLPRDRNALLRNINVMTSREMIASRHLFLTEGELQDALLSRAQWINRADRDTNVRTTMVEAFRRARPAQNRTDPRQS